MRALFDALTGDWVPPSRLDYLNPGDAASRGLHLVPAKLSSPPAADVDRGALGEALKESRKHNTRAVPDADLHDVVEVLQTFRAYLPCDVVAFDSADASHVIFRVLQGSRRMTEHEAVLNALFPRMPEILPFTDAPAPTPPEAEASRAFADAILTEVDGLQDSAAEIQGRIAETAVIIAEAVDDPGESKPATTRMQLEAVRAELDGLRRQYEVVSARLASVRRIEVDEHRPLLVRAIEESRSRLIVIAPWLRDVAMSDLLKPLRKALKERPVHIYIGWGYPDDARNPVREELNESMRRELERMAKERRRGTLHVTRLGDTHEKVLLSDRKFMVITSFNWLSFRGDPKRPLRQETGLYLEIPEKIDEAASVFLQRLGIPPEKQPHVPEAHSSARPALEDDATRLARAGFSVKPSRRSR